MARRKPAGERRKGVALSIEENKALFRRIIEEVWNESNLGVVDELLSEDFVDHSWPPGVGSSREGLKQLDPAFRAFLTNLAFRFS